MASVLNISNAASIGLHAVVLLAARADRLLPTREIAATLGVSEAHLSKVLQRLTKAGLVTATRGPGGGFGLARPGSRIRLIHVYEALEGALKPTDCLLSTRICGGRDCIFGDLLKKLNKEVRQYLAKATLSDLARIFRSGK